MRGVTRAPHPRRIRRERFGWMMILAGVLFTGFAVYHYFHMRGWAAEARANDSMSGVSRIFTVSHGFRGVGSLVMGVHLLAGGIIVLAT